MVWHTDWCVFFPHIFVCGESFSENKPHVCDDTIVCVCGVQTNWMKSCSHKKWQQNKMKWNEFLKIKVPKPINTKFQKFCSTSVINVEKMQN